MKGYVDEFGQPRVEATVMGAKGGATIWAIVDTGFNGEVCLPILIATQLGLELYGYEEMELADGAIKASLVFEGKFILGDESGFRPVRIILTEAADTLLGTELLQGKVLRVNFTTGDVTIE